jgi:hypothetical protein
MELIHHAPGKPFPGPLSSSLVVKRVEVEKREDRLLQLFSIDIHAAPQGSQAHRIFWAFTNHHSAP